MGAILEMDADGDGDVTPKEFAAGLKALRLGLSPAETAQVFEALDADGSGSLQPAELETMLFGRELTPPERAAMREGADRERKHREAQAAPPKADKATTTRELLYYFVPQILREVGRGAIGLGKKPEEQA